MVGPWMMDLLMVGVADGCIKTVVGYGRSRAIYAGVLLFVQGLSNARVDVEIISV
jgi:hypothetical protein